MIIIMPHFRLIGSILIFITCGCLAEEAVKNENEQISGKMKSTNTWEAYKVLLETQRKAQMEIIKHLLGIGNTEKQYDMLKVFIEKTLEVVRESKEVIVAANFAPTDPFPEVEEIRDSLSKLIQSTLLYGDFALRFPTFIHRLYDKSKKTQKLITWCFEFVTATDVTTGTNAAQTIYLASQELNIVERQSDYENPYREEAELKLSKLVEEEMEKIKKKSKPKKGPKLSGRKTEL